MEPVPTAEVYLRRDRIFVAPQHHNQYGFGQSAEPVSDLAQTDNDAALGAAVRAALDASRVDFYFDRADRNKWPPVQRAAKARSWSQFIKGARTLLVERHAAALRVYGVRDDPEDREVAATTAPLTATDGDLGRLVREVAAVSPEATGRKPGS